MAKKPQGNVTTALLDPNKIRYEGTQSRAEIDQGTVSDYAETYQDDPKALPELTVFYDGVDHWLADGFHRLLAAIRQKLKKVNCIVHKGDQRDAILHSVGANHKHGLRRKACDKRKAVAMLLADPEWFTWTDRAVAEHCHVSNHLVADVRAGMAPPDKSFGTPPVYDDEKIEVGEFPPETDDESGNTDESSEPAITEITPPPKEKPKSEPGKRTGLDGKQHPATKPPAEKPQKNGAVTFDPAKFEKAYEYLGHALPKIGALNRTNPMTFYKRAESAIKEAMAIIKEWKKACQR